MTRGQTIFIGTIIFVVVGLLLVFLRILPGRKSSNPPPVTLTVWGMDDKEVWQEIIKSFEKTYPNIIVRYLHIDEENYEDTLINRLAENTGPDVFMLKNSWILRHKDKIVPLPQSAFKFSVSTFKKTFVDIASEDLIDQDGTIYGIPLYIDSLALFYNKDIFNAAGIAEPPQNWEDVLTLTKRLTKISSAGDISRSAIAMGTSKNLAHAFEILSALILQNGDQIVRLNPNNSAVVMDAPSKDALSFYTSFADRTKQNFTWSNLLPYSLDAFAEEKTAMVLGVFGDIPYLLKKNPHLNFGLSFFPQLKNAQTPLTFGEYSFLTVSKFSLNPQDAWNFIMAVNTKIVAEQYGIYTRRPPARRDILATDAPPSETEVFWRQALIAKSWPIPNYSATAKLFNEVMESIASRSTSIPQGFNRIREQLRLLVT